MINIQPAAENKWALNKFYGKQKLIIYETIDFEDQICVLPAGPKSFYLPSFLSAGLFGGSTANKK